MSAADSLRAWLAPLLPGWALQFGRWVDRGGAERYAVLRPVGGRAASLVREPAFTLLLVGAAGGAETAPYAAAQAVIEAARTTGAAGLVTLRVGEPVSSATSDGRATVELSITTITN